MENFFVTVLAVSTSIIALAITVFVVGAATLFWEDIVEIWRK